MLSKRQLFADSNVTLRKPSFPKLAPLALSSKVSGDAPTPPTVAATLKDPSPTLTISSNRSQKAIRIITKRPSSATVRKPFNIPSPQLPVEKPKLTLSKLQIQRQTTLRKEAIESPISKQKYKVISRDMKESEKTDSYEKVMKTTVRKIVTLGVP